MKAFALSIGLLVGSSAFAMTQDEIDYENAMTQMDLNNGNHEIYQSADAEMNTIWKQARAEAKKQDADVGDGRSADTALLASQRGWINYRDGQCELARFVACRGSMEPMLAAIRKAKMTRARTKELKNFVTGEDQ